MHHPEDSDHWRSLAEEFGLEPESVQRPAAPPQRPAPPPSTPPPPVQRTSAFEAPATPARAPSVEAARAEEVAPRSSPPSAQARGNEGAEPPRGEPVEGLPPAGDGGPRGT